MCKDRIVKLKGFKFHKAYIKYIGLILFVLVLLFGVERYFFDKELRQHEKIQFVDLAHVDSISEIKDSIVKPILYSHIPDFKGLSIDVKVKKFIDIMLPSVLLAREKVIKKRHKIIELNAAVKAGVATKQDSLYLNKLKKKYKANSINDVIKRLHPHPVSIILAQAAIESGWGSSRFCREANNIYGIWSYNTSEKRIKAGNTRNGKAIYLRSYGTLFESVYDYLETIAKANAYRQFRKARLHTDDPFRLIWYLSNYSEKRFEYVHTLRNVIEYYKLNQYDHYKLALIDCSDKSWKKIFDN